MFSYYLCHGSELPADDTPIETMRHELPHKTSKCVTPKRITFAILQTEEDESTPRSLIIVLGCRVNNMPLCRLVAATHRESESRPARSSDKTAVFAGVRVLIMRFANRRTDARKTVAAQTNMRYLVAERISQTTPPKKTLMIDQVVT